VTTVAVMVDAAGSEVLHLDGETERLSLNRSDERRGAMMLLTRDGGRLRWLGKKRCR
jgi:hypothetical protein